MAVPPEGGQPTPGAPQAVTNIRGPRRRPGLRGRSLGSGVQLGLVLRREAWGTDGGLHAAVQRRSERGGRIRERTHALDVGVVQQLVLADVRTDLGQFSLAEIRPYVSSWCWRTYGRISASENWPSTALLVQNNREP